MERERKKAMNLEKKFCLKLCDTNRVMKTFVCFYHKKCVTKNIRLSDNNFFTNTLKELN